MSHVCFVCGDALLQALVGFADSIFAKDVSTLVQKDASSFLQTVMNDEAARTIEASLIR